MTKYGMAINLDRCIGCHTCANACKMQNNVPSGMLWNRVLTEGSDVIYGAVGDYPNLSRTFVPVACQHCENPACQRVCPTGATHISPDGIVLVDHGRCIGCKYCMAACPYQVRTFNEEEGIADKCRFCTVSASDGGTKMCTCVEACLTGARIFGDLDDPDSEISKQVKELNAQPIKGDLTDVKVFYVR